MANSWEINIPTPFSRVLGKKTTWSVRGWCMNKLRALTSRTAESLSSSSFDTLQISSVGLAVRRNIPLANKYLSSVYYIPGSVFIKLWG